MQYDVRKYGAAGDGRTDDTASVQNCIDLCSSKGGGTVLLDEGTFRCGTLFLKSDVTIKITESAVLLASPDIGEYSADTHYNRYRNEKDLDRCFLYAQDEKNLCITGNGRIVGNAEAFPNKNSIYRPMMIRFLRCENITLEQVRLLDSAAWTTAFLDSRDIWVRNVKIHNDKRYNGDGLDFDGCQNVFIDNCQISGTDDNLCLQSSSKNYPMENVHITNCQFRSICAAIRIGLKSIGTIRDVVISNCTMRNVWREGIKIECSEGGEISDISVQNIVMHNVSRPVFVLLNNRFLPDDLGSSIELIEMPQIGAMKNLTFSNITAVDDEEMQKPHMRFGKDLMGAPWFNGIRIDAEENHPIKNVTFCNVRYESIGGVKKTQIPEEYPAVEDQLRSQKKLTSENYYPDWSRAAFLDIRNVDGLYCSAVQFCSQYEDERKAYYIEQSRILKQEIFIENKEMERKKDERRI